jgi:peptide/nickel transport system ATP-binding protein
MTAPDHCAPQAAAPLLEVLRLSKRYTVGSLLSRGGRAQVQALDDVTLRLWPGETLGLVGESGCGKSTLARCIVRLQDSSGGLLRFGGQDITHLGGRALRAVRPDLQMVFQDPYTSLNPRRRVRDLLAEPLRVHGRRSAADIAGRVRELAELVGLLPEQLDRFPHEFSGGQRQRIGIARALALAPRLIVADEPVSALDVSIQAQVINLLADLQQRLGLTMLFIAHDLSVVRQVSTRTAVMYLGSIVESAPTDALYAAPAHPYTQALIHAVPVPDVRGGTRREREARQRAQGAAAPASRVLGGDPPSPLNPPDGCRFHPRCPAAQPSCRTMRPALRDLGGGRLVACHFPLTDVGTGIDVGAARAP